MHLAAADCEGLNVHCWEWHDEGCIEWADAQIAQLASDMQATLLMCLQLQNPCRIQSPLEHLDGKIKT